MNDILKNCFQTSGEWCYTLNKERRDPMWREMRRDAMLRRYAMLRRDAIPMSGTNNYKACNTDDDCNKEAYLSNCSSACTL